MGDRTTWYEPCPKCGVEMECYDAPSSLIWSRRCDCGYVDNREYYETEPNTIELLPTKVAFERGLLKDKDLEDKLRQELYQDELLEMKRLDLLEQEDEQLIN